MRARARQRAGATLLAFVGLLGVVAPTSAEALEVPNIDGHMTDPGKMLGKTDKTNIEEKLSKLQQDTRVDVAGWIVDSPEGTLDDLGHEAFKKWHIGGEWDNALFFVIPRNGRAHLIQNDAKPELTAAEAAKVVAADKPSAAMQQRLDLIMDTAGEIVRAKSLKARPAGVRDPARGLRFGIGFAALALLSIGLSWRAARKQRALARSPLPLSPLPPTLDPAPAPALDPAPSPDPSLAPTAPDP